MNANREVAEMDNPADGVRLRGVGGRDGPEVRAPEGQRQILQDHRKAEGREDLHRVRGIHDALDDEALHQHAEHEDRRHDHDGRQVRIDAQQHIGPERAEHRQHDEFALREIHDPQYAEDEGQADREQGVDAPDQDARDQQLRKDRQH